MSNYQFGLKKGYSSYMALTKLIDKIARAMDKGEHIMWLLLDFAEAFDTVNHKMILRKLNHFEIRGTVLQWFQSNLSSRKQTVWLGETNYDLKNITCRVPQRSILGPLLCIIYKKSFKCCVTNHLSDNVWTCH